MWQKYVIGFPLILLIMDLLMGPMFIFSPVFGFIGSPNPVSKVTMSMDLNINYMNEQN